MTPPTAIVWEDRLTRLSFAFLVLAIAYGIGAGTVIAMYYDAIPDMSLGAVQLFLFFPAVLISFSHLPMLMSDFKHKLWQQAIVRAMVSVSPLIIFLGTEGLIAHLLWWSPISDPDRFHLLHHTVFAGAPLTLGYWLALRQWWHPTKFSVASSPSLKSWLVTGIALVIFVMAVGILAGLVSLPVFGLTVALGLIALPMIRRVAG